MPKLTEAEKSIRQELLNKYRNHIIKGGVKVGEFSTFTGFRKWAMANGFQPGSDLRRHDTEDDFTPENCYFAPHVAVCPFSVAWQRDFIRRWNAAVNPLRRLAGLRPFPDPAAECKKSLPE